MPTRRFRTTDLPAWRHRPQRENFRCCSAARTGANILVINTLGARASTRWLDDEIRLGSAECDTKTGSRLICYARYAHAARVRSCAELRKTRMEPHRYTRIGIFNARWHVQFNMACYSARKRDAAERVLPMCIANHTSHTRISPAIWSSPVAGRWSRWSL